MSTAPTSGAVLAGLAAPDASGAAALPDPRGELANPRRFARNAAALALARVWEMVSSAIWLALLNRHFGVAGMGKIYAILSFITLVTVIPAMGMDQALVRLTSRRPRNAAVYLGVAIVVRNLLSLVAIGIVVGTALLAHWEHDVFLATMIACVWVLADLSLSTNYAVYLAFEKTHYQTALTVLYNSLILPVTLVALHYKTGLIGVFAAMSAADAFTMFCGWIITTRRFVKPVFRWDPALVKEMLHLCFTIGFTRSIRTFYNRIDTMLLLALVPGGTATRLAAVGIYNTAYSLLRKGVTFQAVLARPLLPIASRAVDYPERLQSLHRKAFKMLLLISVAACGTVVAGSSVLVHVMTGSRFGEFAPAVPLLAFLSFLLLTAYATSSLRVVMIALEMQGYLLRQSLVMLAINFVGDVVLIRLLAPAGLTWWGPAIASFIAEMYLVIVIMRAVSRRVGCYPDLGDSLKILGAGVVMVAAGLASGLIWRPLSLVVAPVVYIVAVLALRIVRRNELAAFRGGGGGGRRRGARRGADGTGGGDGTGGDAGVPEDASRTAAAAAESAAAESLF